MANLGFGAYRVSSKSSEHKNALLKAVNSGCQYIDTSSNYTNGESELLVGEVLKEAKLKPFVFSKVGYIQGDNLKVVEKESLSEDLVDLSADLKHSIHPDFIKNQLLTSLRRMGLESLNAYLLHNPEYYLKSKGSSKDEYYLRLEKAFLYLEKLSNEGFIQSYGVSSNTLVDPKDEHESTNIEIVLDIIKKNKLKKFKYVQFPLNLLELGALEKQFSGQNLIEFCKSNGLVTIINRPFNAFTDQGFVRLCEYDTRSLTEDFAKTEFERLTKSLVDKWNVTREDNADDINDLAIYKQVSQIWYQQNSVDAVEQIFFGHFFNIVSSIWARDLTASESKPFYELFDLAVEYSKFNMTKRAQDFKRVAVAKGLLPNDNKELSFLALDKYSELGIDIILCGMRKTSYVDKLKSYF